MRDVTQREESTDSRSQDDGEPQRETKDGKSTPRHEVEASSGMALGDHNAKSDFHAGEPHTSSGSDFEPGQPPPSQMRPRTDEHGWQGKLFVGLSWLGFWGTIAGAAIVLLLPFNGTADPGPATLIAGFMVGVAVFQYWWIRAVRDFDKRGWIGLAILLPLGGVAYLVELASGETFAVLQGFVGIALTLVWIEYFARIRDKYGIAKEDWDLG